MDMAATDENEFLGEIEYEGEEEQEPPHVEIDVGDYSTDNIKQSLPIWATPPWPEWNDSSVNVEVWEINESVERFVDPTGRILPRGIKPVKWIRPELLLEPPKLVDWEANTIDLINANIQICAKSDMIRFMLSEISELYDYGIKNVFQVEGESQTFISNSDHHIASWRPWDHIYSMCKAGVKGDRPTLNKIGKYYVRLYYLGAWRRITVDDQIPLLQGDIIGLPITTANELWPLILIKALTKVAALSWDHEIDTGIDRMHRFSTTSALTGWVNEWIDVVEPIDSVKLWEDLNDVLPKYQGQPQTRTNFWTTGKTKKERELEQIAADRILAEKAKELPPDLYTNWWTLTSLLERDPGVEYLEDSDSDDGTVATAASLQQDSDFPSSAQSIFSVSEMEAADEAEDTELEELMNKEQEKIAASAKKGKKDKSKKGKKGEKERKTAPDILNADDKQEATVISMISETEAAIDAEDNSKKSGKKEVKPKPKKPGKKETKDNKEKPQKKVSTDNKSQIQIALPEPEPIEENVDIPILPGDIIETTEIAIQTAVEEIVPERQKSTTKGKAAKGKAVKDKKGKKTDETPKKRRSGSTRLSGNTSQRKKFHDGETSEDEGNEEALPVVDVELVETKKLSFVEDLVTEEIYVKPKIKIKVPMMKDILVGVHKYLGTENFPLVAAWESLCGKNIPDAITVVLSAYPRVEERGTVIPSYLFHPINFVEVRDIPLMRDPGRPITPLWKTFRWKAWAMKKGLIPLETDPNEIRCIKANTPFALKTDWYPPRQVVTHRVEPLGTREEEVEDGGGTPTEVCGQPKTTRSSIIPLTEIVGATAIEISASTGNTSPPATSALATGTEISVVSTKTPPNTNVTSEKSRHPKASSAQKRLSSNSNSGKGGSSETHKGQNQVTSGHHGVHSSHHSNMHKKHGDGPKSKDKKHSTDEEMWLWGESDEMDSAPLPTPVSDYGSYEMVPSSACASVWFHVDNISQYVRKICKFYSTRTMFGSCFILRRKPEWTTDEDSAAPIPSIDVMPVSHKEIADCHAIPDSFNLTIQFENSKVLSIMNYHLDKTRGMESAFYLFCDCWMDQEILISLDILQSLDVTGYADKTNTIAWNYPDEAEMYEEENETTPMSPINIEVVLEPWDWREDYYLQTPTPLVHCLSETQWSAHVTLRPGRSIYRIWVAENPEQGEGIYNANPYTMSPYVIKFAAKTPIHIGTRDEVINYMTNEPVLLLKQCDILAQNIWTMFLLFGKPRRIYAPSFRSLHKSYCPSNPVPDVVNKTLKSVHFSFEDRFVTLIVELNEGILERRDLLALKCLFLNPKLGQDIWDALPKPHHHPSTFNDQISEFTNLAVFDISEAKQEATFVIQRYLRGWLVRRLFQLRTTGRPGFPRIEYHIRRIAFLLSRNTDSAFNHQTNPTDEVVAVPEVSEQKMKSQENLTSGSAGLEQTGSGEEDNAEVFVTDTPVSPASETPSPGVPPTLVPNPPKWAVRLLKGLLKEYPELISLHLHTDGVPHHVKVRDTEGVIPPIEKDSKCKPFYRRVVSIVGEGNWCTCMIQLQVSPATGVVLRVIDNDHETCLETPTEHCFVGKLEYNRLGYTILCYRFPSPGEFASSKLLEDVRPSHHWKVRIVTPKHEDHLAYKDEIPHEHHHHHHTDHTETTLPNDHKPTPPEEQ